ncbi:hypothetical protein AMATHDRAFT_7810 [Amanita thiersii Skay4041]|uniref:BTB domain-containing protein n=1 Tax=Amanita thiersii Skay4041 TaxID=703135 RepID=A0A2A9NFE8_9AGAR|nr:hypothetical protein AMATHDRAFT_7810 [Amanita thiersii Skay4041]
MASTVSPQPPSLQEATRKSTLEWQLNLKSLFQHSKDRFPDVVWELTAEDDYEDRVIEEVWGHKAIVYARAPPTFQSRYFSFKPNPLSSSPYPYPSSPIPGFNATSTPSFTDEVSQVPSPNRVASPVPSSVQGHSNNVLRIRTSINPTLFSNELEYLYTGQGFGEAFEFLYDSFESRLTEQRPEGDAEEVRIDKLRKDLVYMWRSRLYSDVKIALTGNFSSSPHEDTTAIFSSHRFILVSRCPYFYNDLVLWPKSKQQQSNESITVSLPSPPFTPASLHFILGFLYTGTLIFSNRNYDLSTAFSILRSAAYLSLDTLHDEVQARIVQEMMHGLFHAFLSFPEYERLTNRKWGTGGCRCRQCARRAPRVLEFALGDDVKNPHLERGARRALVGLFGEGWCTSEFAGLPQKLRESLLKGVGKRTTPENVFSILFASEHALLKLNPIIDPWGDVVREMINDARRVVDEVLCNSAEACFNQPDWVELMENDGVHFEDGERVEWVMAAVLRGVNEKNSAMLYQTLVSAILLRPHPTEPNEAMLSTTSHIHVQVENTRMDLLRWIGKRWMNVRQEGGFDDLEGWAVKEISDFIEVMVEDLLMPVPKAGPLRVRNTHGQSRSFITGDAESETASIRVSLLSRNLPYKRNVTPTTREKPDRGSEPLSSSGASVYSARSNFSTSTASPRRTTMAGNVRNGLNTVSRAGARKISGPDTRPDSKLTPEPPKSDISRSPSPTPTTPVVEHEAERDTEEMSESKTGTDELIEQDQNASEEANAEGQQAPQDAIEEDAAQDSQINSDTSSIISTAPSMQKTLISKIVIPPSVSGASSPSLRRNGNGMARTGSTISSTATTNSGTTSLRPKSSASSMRSAVSTLRKSSGTSSSLRPHSGRQNAGTNTRSALSSRPVSNASTTSTSEAYKTASTYSSTGTAVTARSRRLSAASSLSVKTAEVGGASPSSATSSPVHLTPGHGHEPRVRRVSGASVNTVTNSAGRINDKKRADSKVSPTAKRAGSLAPSIKPTPSGSSLQERERKVSTGTARMRKTSSADKRPGSARKADEVIPPSPLNRKDKQSSSAAATPSDNDHKKSGSNASNATLKTKKSNDTITSKVTKSVKHSPAVSKDVLRPPPHEQREAGSEDTTMVLPPLKENLPIIPRGATLEIGIPCIITSKRKRFKAYARYIGEVEGELGPWVGVEVPMGSGDSWAWAGEREDGNGGDGGRQWHDGSWGGIRYFDIGGVASEWDYGEDRSRRRRLGDSINSKFDKGYLKREGEQLSVRGFSRAAKRLRSASPAVSDISGVESRGLFVRPQQVLYVVDAVGSDL